jgi:putative acetyltransferase
LVKNDVTNMIELKRTNSQDLDFRKLVELLDKDLSERDGEDHSFYAQYNTLANINEAIVCYENGMAIGCGAIKKYDEQTAEVKRMFVVPTHRGKGIASSVLAGLEKWAKELGYEYCILETGQKQPEAIKLYQKSGHQTIPNYGQYIGVANSICMKKPLNP